MRAGDICHYLPGRQEGTISQQLGNVICLVKVIVTRDNRAQNYERKTLESSGRKEGDEKGSNSRNGKEKEFGDRRRALAGKVEGLYSREEQETFKEEGKQ